ncbi:aspC [Symbiodinium natans]|uniref:AspC protein n=1 Tax=Symbiodinium natans TaxID=878477 RepID=A0A812SIR0_9DINO|nr:aspC [Symbiodinium natans]
MTSCCGFRIWMVLFMSGVLTLFLYINTVFGEDDFRESKDPPENSQTELQEAAKTRSVSSPVKTDIQPQMACLALISVSTTASELQIREELMGPLQEVADSLVKGNFVDTWMTVDYSAAYKRGVNTTAQWGDLSEFRPGHTHGRSFDDSQTADIELAHYYAVDQCDAPYIAIFQTDMIMYTQRGYSWVEEAMQALRDNEGLVLIIPAFPGIASRRVRHRPTTRPIAKFFQEPLQGQVKLEETTCQHPFTLPGRATLLDIHRYRRLPARSQIMENHNGQVDPGSKTNQCYHAAPSFELMAHLSNWQKSWVQHAPLTSVRYDMARLKTDVIIIESGRDAADMGSEYKGLAT